MPNVRGVAVLGTHNSAIRVRYRFAYVTTGVDENLSMTRSGSAYYYMADGLGSVRNVIDADEDVANTYDYYAFGNTLGTPTTSVTNPFEYTGREFEDGSVNTTFYYRNRYYMSGLGIFTSRDAMWADGARGWGYVGNLPTVFSDPFGLREPYVEETLCPGYARIPSADVRAAVAYLQWASNYRWNTTCPGLTRPRTGESTFWECNGYCDEMLLALRAVVRAQAANSALAGAPAGFAAGSGCEDSDTEPDWEPSLPPLPPGLPPLAILGPECIGVGSVRIGPITGHNWFIWDHEALRIYDGKYTWDVDPWADHLRQDKDEAPILTIRQRPDME